MLQATKEADDVARKNASQKLVAYANDPAIVEHEERDKLLSSGRVVSEMNISDAQTYSLSTVQSKVFSGFWKTWWDGQSDLKAIAEKVWIMTAQWM